MEGTAHTSIYTYSVPLKRVAQGDDSVTHGERLGELHTERLDQHGSSARVNFKDMDVGAFTHTHAHKQGSGSVMQLGVLNTTNDEQEMALNDKSRTYTHPYIYRPGRPK